MITFRLITNNDKPFIEELYRSTREGELEKTGWTELQKQKFIMMQSIAQETSYRNKYPDALFQVILYKNKPAGRLYLASTSTHLHIIDISLLPLYRGKGIGTKIISDLAKKAKSEKKIIGLNVRKENRANKLYLKLGFKYIDYKNEYYYMELNPK